MWPWSNQFALVNNISVIVTYFLDKLLMIFLEMLLIELMLGWMVPSSKHTEEVVHLIEESTAKSADDSHWNENGQLPQREREISEFTKIQ